MGKAVKKIGRAVGKVGRSIGKVVKGVAKVAKKVAKSKVGKILIAAAAVYFGGAAIAGAMGGASAGTGVMGTLSGAVQGAGTGIANAWTSLGTAATQALGGNFANAGTALSGGFQGSSVTVGANNALTTTPLSFAAAPATAPSAATQTLGSATLPNGLPVGVDPNSAAVTNYLQSQPIPPAGKPGIIGGAWNSLGDYGKMAAVQVTGNTVQGIGAQKAADDAQKAAYEQRQYEEQQAQAARDRYNANVGSSWWSDGAQPGTPMPYGGPPQSGLILGGMNPQQQYAEDMRRRLMTYTPYTSPTSA